MIFSRYTNTPQFRTCNKGKNVIDHALCSPTLIPCIRTSCYEPFMITTLSDHRGIVIDFDTRLLIGKQELITSPDRRGVNANNPVQVELFIQHLQKYWVKYNIAKRIEQATDEATDLTHLRSIVNSIDKDITNAMLRAERRVRRSEKPPWSPALKQASLLVKYYKLLRQQHILKTDLSTAIQHTTEQMDTTPVTPMKPQDYQSLLRKAQKSLKKTRQMAQANRTQHLDTLLQKYELLQDDKMKMIIRRIIQAEATKRCYKKLRWLTKPPKPGVTFVERTKEDGTMETLYDREILENAILHRNQQHFNQCAGTPFTVGRLRELNWAADSALADSILHGHFDPASITDNHIVQHVLQLCKQQRETISDYITFNDLQQLFNKWKESTTTSPSGRHLGIYWAIFHHQSSNKKSTIGNNITSLLNILIRNGISLDRWRRVTNMMIHKIDGSYNINKLRVIHLFEADYNGLIGILFNRRVLYQAEKDGLLNNNQWRGRPHRQAEDALMLKELTYNMAITTKTTLATFDNDATGCFDRVPCTVAMLSSRRLGATKNICKMQADNLSRIEHSLRTAFGTSSTSYTSDSTCEIHGQGQGSRAGPPTWVFVSSLILDGMQQLANGLHFTCPNQELIHQRTNDAFVDDVTGYANRFVAELTNTTVLDEVVRTMQEDATLWNNLLHTSGGKLALQKCLYYVLTWKWTSKGATILPAREIPNKITLNDDQQSTPIQHYDCNKAHRTLGQFKAPNGNQSDHLHHMEKKSRNWLIAIKEAQLTRQEAHAAYTMIWFPSLSYGLGTTNLNYNELDSIQKPVINRILPALGYNRHLPRAVVFGSSRFGGLHFKHLYIDQGTKHVSQFIKYYRNGGTIGDLLKISLRWLHLVAGFSFCPLARPQLNYHHIEDKWYRTTIRFLYECNASIETNTIINVLCREHDSCLMEDFLLQDPTPTELRLLNSCRLYLRVTTLSDISSANGNTITQQCWEGMGPTDAIQLWPRQQKPHSKAWLIWRKYITRCYLDDEYSTRKKRTDLQLDTPLGPWLPGRIKRHRKSYHINPINLTIYRTTANGLHVYSPCRNTRTQLKYQLTGRTTYQRTASLPIDCTTPTSKPHVLIISKNDIPKTLPSQRPTIHTLRDYIKTLDPWEQHLLRTYQYPTREILQHLAEDIIIASDGSVNDQGSFGWVIATMTGSTIATGSGVAFGLTISSFRSEAYGFLAALRFLYRIQTYYHQPLTHRTTTWICDSESLIKRIQSNLGDTHNPNRYKLADNDLEFAIVSTLPLVTTELKTQHIRSHQNDHKPIHQLPTPQRLNRIADNLAANVHKEHHPQTKHVPLITIAGCQLRTKQGTITRSYTRMLHAAFTDQSTSTYLCNRLNIHSNILTQIAWDEFERAFRSLSTGSKRIIRRWMFGYLPTQYRLARYKQSNSSLCPVCKQHDETDVHFLICGGSKSWHDNFFNPLERLCQTSTNNQQLANTFRTGTRMFLDGRTPPYSVQSDIGWTAAFSGLLTSEWITTYEIQNGSHFLTKLVKLLLSAVITRWKERCNLLHKPGKDTNEQRMRLQHTIRTLYSCKNDVLQQDREIFSLPLQQLLLSPTPSLRLFITQFKSIIKQSTRKQRELVRRQHKDISTYFIRPT